jgi:hypothetical protein
MIRDSDPLPPEPTPPPSPRPAAEDADPGNGAVRDARQASASAPAFTLRNWRRLTEATQRESTHPARKALEDMVAWVDWLIGRYRLGHTIPPCWWAHGPMVEELSALEAAWRGAYEAADKPADAGVNWHQQLGQTLLRIEEWNVERCTFGQHRPVGDYDQPTDLLWPPDPSRTATGS